MIRATASDIEALRAALAVAEARAEEAVAKASNAEAIIAALKLMVEKLRREVYGQRSERKARLLDQLELARGAGGARERGRARRRTGSREDLDSQVFHSQAAIAQAVPGASAARARGGSGA